MRIAALGFDPRRLHWCRTTTPAQNKKGSSVDSDEPFLFAQRIGGLCDHLNCCHLQSRDSPVHVRASKKAQLGQKAQN